MNRQNTTLKYLALGSAAIFLVGLTVWLVRMEGERTRDAMRDAAKEAGTEVREGVVEGAERAVEKAAEVPGKVLRDVTDELPSGVAEEAGQAAAEAVRTAGELARTAKDTLTGQPPESDGEPGAEEAPPAGQELDEPQPPDPAEPEAPPKETPAAPPVPQPPVELVPTPAPKPPRPTKPADPAPTMPEDLIERLYDFGRDVSKAVDDVGQEILALSWEEERQAGREVHRALARDYRLLRPPAVIGRLERLARPIAQQRTRKELALTFHVIASNEVNAFAHAGGYVYVTTGLLDLLQSDPDLQFILAHEIAHHELRHVTRRVTYAARAGEVGGEVGRNLAQVAYMAIAIGYSEEEELEADAWAFRAMLQAGRSRDAALAGTRRMLAYVAERDLEPKPVEARTPAEKTLRHIENHFRSHPPTAERLEALEAIEVSPRGRGR